MWLDLSGLSRPLSARHTRIPSPAIQRGLLMPFDDDCRGRGFLKRHIFCVCQSRRLTYLRRVQDTFQKLVEEFTERWEFFPLGNIMNARKFEYLRELALICQASSLSGYDDRIPRPDGEQYGCRNCWLVDRLVSGS